MIHPTIHLGGTPRARLIESWCEARNAVESALQLLIQAAPNGRDYPQGPDAYDRARAEHDARITALRQVSEDLLTLAVQADG